MKPPIYSVLLISTGLLFSSCTTPPKAKAPSNANEHLLNATLWQQSAGETKALFYQGYNVATQSLGRKLIARQSSKPPAVILDIDETILDNSPYQARCILEGYSFPVGWTNWVKESRARALPGAMDFLHYADSQGVAIFYVSNRRKTEGEEAPTIRNLKRLGAPQARTERMFLMSANSSKEERRARIMSNYDVLLLIGDQLGDFTGEFEKRSMETRNRLVERNRAKFGDRYIVLPNPMYGDFEQAIYHYDFTKGQDSRSRQRRGALRSR